MNEIQLLAGYMTRTELAAQLGITERTIANYENLPDGEGPYIFFHARKGEGMPQPAEQAPA